MSNRFDSYLKGAKLARMLAAQAKEKFDKGEDRKALRDIIAAFGALLVATNNFAHLQFNPRKKNPLKVKRIIPVTTPRMMPGAKLIITSERVLTPEDNGGSL